MSAAYGDFLAAFPELMEKFKVWHREETEEQCRYVKGVFVPAGGSELNRKKFTSGNWVGEISDTDCIYVGGKYAKDIKIGDYFRRNEDTYLCSVVQRMEYLRSADYCIFGLERVMGDRQDMVVALDIKEAEFD